MAPCFTSAAVQATQANATKNTNRREFDSHSAKGLEAVLSFWPVLLVSRAARIRIVSPYNIRYHRAGRHRAAGGVIL
jgi:hypothetical protein